MNGIIYYTKIRDEYNGKNMEHMIGEKLLEIGLEREFGRKLAFEPRSKGEHGKPFFTLLPRIHYNITHSGKYVMCLFAGEEVGIDVQIHATQVSRLKVSLENSGAIELAIIASYARSGTTS